MKQLFIFFMQLFSPGLNFSRIHKEWVQVNKLVVNNRIIWVNR